MIAKTLTSVAPPRHYVLPTIPAANRAHVLIDFDGTITRVDVLDQLIRRYAIDDSWLLVEEAWQRGEIGSLECLRREFDAIRIAPAELSRFVDAVPLDSGADTLFALLRRHHAPVAILSDGVDQFIRQILARVGLSDVPIYSNSIEHQADRLRLIAPRHVPACEFASAHCKCASARGLIGQAWGGGDVEGGGEEPSDGRRSIYVGDGRSDLCAAGKSDVVFAKGALATALRKSGKPFLAFDTLADVARVLASAWGDAPR
jgi:2-hydroxy-3-keto-5-methylthiopentenyl-1-phosphate phosphatase